MGTHINSPKRMEDFIPWTTNQLTNSRHYPPGNVDSDNETQTTKYQILLPGGEYAAKQIVESG